MIWSGSIQVQFESAAAEGRERERERELAGIGSAAPSRSCAVRCSGRLLRHHSGQFSLLDHQRPAFAVLHLSFAFAGRPFSSITFLPFELPPPSFRQIIELQFPSTSHTRSNTRIESRRCYWSSTLIQLSR
ncbi:hypothetical protein PIB30_044277 [Stylosanthes scabra]|uniref:Uncharacterized protein n=1 Tax=Stylosanthes scabra TaxID=79078 RepID=A0ABU6SH18_9FABA|nr:hypothetical protein [Stylosanthes scabra]